MYIQTVRGSGERGYSHFELKVGFLFFNSYRPLGLLSNIIATDERVYPHNIFLISQ